MYKGSKQMRFESLSIMRLELYGHRALKRSKEYGKKTTSARLKALFKQREVRRKVGHA